MSTPAAVIGVTYRAVDIQDLDGLFLEIMEGLDGIPIVRGSNQVVPGRPGQIWRPKVVHQWPIVLGGKVRGVGADELADRAAYRANVQLMQSLFDPTLEPGPLVAALEDGSIATIQAVGVEIMPRKVVPSMSLLSIECVSFDAAWVLTVGS